MRLLVPLFPINPLSLKIKYATMRMIESLRNLQVKKQNFSTQIGLQYIINTEDNLKQSRCYKKTFKQIRYQINERLKSNRTI